MVEGRKQKNGKMINININMRNYIKCKWTKIPIERQKLWKINTLNIKAQKDKCKVIDKVIQCKH